MPKRVASFFMFSQTVATLVRRESWVSKREESIFWPLPVRRRAWRAARMAPCVYSPVEMSVSATPGLVGGPSRSPVMWRRPASAAAMIS